jgi:hypothetical protein
MLCVGFKDSQPISCCVGFKVLQPISCCVGFKFLCRFKVLQPM